MYIGVDIGGTKTLIASLTDDGIIDEQIKFPTPENYDQFLTELSNNFGTLKTNTYNAATVAAPGSIDRMEGVARSFGNLPWSDVPIKRDTEIIFGCPVALENDANLAGLSEAMLLKNTHQKVLYITISTGIGTGFIVNQKIDPSMADSEGGDLMIQRDGKLVKWETFASGKAIFNHYEKRAEDITDPEIWKLIAEDLCVGFLDLIAVTQPDVIVVGGGVGTYLDRFHDFLVADMKQYENPLLQIPPVQKAVRPEEAVIYGCYELARELYGRTSR